MRRFTFAMLVLFAGASVAWAGPNAEFDRALDLSTQTAEALQSYDLAATLQVKTLVAGQEDPIEMEVHLLGAARWPDRMLSSQDSEMFRVNVGVGADQSWFHLGQMQATYVGPARQLSRVLDRAAQVSLEEEDLFNFYSGIGSFLLNRNLQVEPGTGTETLTVDGRQIKCQVFNAPADPNVDPAGGMEGDKTFWFDPASGLVIQASIRSQMQQQGMQMDQQLTFRLDRFELNGKVPEERFQYQPGPDERVVSSLDRVMNPDSLVGEPAADITFTDFEGKSVQLADYRGKVVFLDFWATWCGPCKMEMPHIQALHEELAASGQVVFLGASSEAAETIQGFLAKNGYSFPIVMVKQEDAQKKYKVSSIPAGFVIDREGVIRAHLIGAQSEEQLRKALAKAGI